MTNKAKRLSGINTLAYLGIEPITAPLLLVEQRIPTTDDRVGNQIGALWILEQTDTVPARIFLLVRLQGSGPSCIATWLELTTGGAGGANQFNTDNGIVLEVGGIVNVLGGTTMPGGVATNINTFANPNMSNNLFVALNNSIFFPDTTDINNGVIGFGGSADGNRFLHNFGAGGGSDGNTFLGLASGNFTLTGIHLVGIGSGALVSTTTGSDNVAVGDGAGSSITAGNRNITIGSLAGASLTTGSDNVAIGDGALGSQQTSDQLVAIGTDALGTIQNTSVRLTAVGYQALNLADAACDNVTAFGWHAGFNAVTVSSSVFIGENAGASASGIRNTFVGVECGSSGCSGTQNTGVGADALRSATTTLNSTAVGRRALFSLTTGNNNVAVGQEALRDLTTAQGNVAVGTFALISASTISDNIAIGRSALLNLTNQSERNIAIGTLAAANYTGSGTGESSLAIGHNAMNAATTQNRMMAIGDSAMLTGQGDNTMAIGFQAAENMGFSTSSVLIGYQAGRNLNTGSGVNGGIRTVALGTQAIGVGALTGQHNVMIGFQAGNNLTTAAECVSVGAFALDAATSAESCISMGTSSLGSLLTGTHNIALGSTAGNSYVGAESHNISLNAQGTAAESNTLRIGSATGTGTQQLNRAFICGIRGITTGVADAIAVLVDSANQLGTVSSSARYKDNIQDMDEESSPVMELRPVTFTYKNDEQQRMQYGLIAEEVDKVMPRLVVYDEEGLPQSVRYNDLPQLLLNELKKLEKRVAHLERLCDTCKHIPLR